MQHSSQLNGNVSSANQGSLLGKALQSEELVRVDGMLLGTQSMIDFQKWIYRSWNGEWIWGSPHRNEDMISSVFLTTSSDCCSLRFSTSAHKRGIFRDDSNLLKNVKQEAGGREDPDFW
jgi:hypothetical protein